jgi:hypothetical protein
VAVPAAQRRNAPLIGEPRPGRSWHRDYLPGVTRRRGLITVRRVPLRSAEASDARVTGTLAERLALVSTLSLSAWANTGKPLPVYSRASMVVRRFRLGAERGRD